MTCEIVVLYFAKSSELAGVRSENLTVPQEITSNQLWEKIAALHPGLCAIKDHIVLAVRQEYVTIGDEVITLRPGDEVAVIPPISAAMDEQSEEPQDFIRICPEKLSTEEVSELVVSPSCGAVSIFVGNSLLIADVRSLEPLAIGRALRAELCSSIMNGTTRNNFDGKKVVHLEYEAYVPMAEAEIKKILTDIRQKWPSVQHMAVYHRLGLVPITEASVIIAISSPHRDDSLEAVKFCINTLKTTVPIWKKEVYEKEDASWKENKECFWRKQEDK